MAKGLLPPPEALRAALQWQRILGSRTWLCVLCLHLGGDPREAGICVNHSLSPVSPTPTYVRFPTGERLPVFPASQRLTVCRSCQQAHGLEKRFPPICIPCGSVVLRRRGERLSEPLPSSLWGWWLASAQGEVECHNLLEHDPMFLPCQDCVRALRRDGWVRCSPPFSPPHLTTVPGYPPKPPPTIWSTVDGRIYRTKKLCLANPPTPAMIHRALTGVGFRSRWRVPLEGRHPPRYESKPRHPLHLVPFRLEDLRRSLWKVAEGTAAAVANDDA